MINMDNMEDSLLPCPFCGKTVSLAMDNTNLLGLNRYAAVCGTTGCFLGISVDYVRKGELSTEDAIRVWNTRDGEEL